MAIARESRASAANERRERSFGRKHGKEQRGSRGEPQNRQRERGARDPIAEAEAALLKPKDWRLSGEVRASMRASNTLLDQPVEFDTALVNVPISSDQNTAIARLIAQRFKEKTFDNFEFKDPRPQITEERYDTTALETSKEITALFEELERTLKGMTDGGIDTF